MANGLSTVRLTGKNGIFNFRVRPELKELYAFSVIFSFAYALIVIFEPVFFYQQGFSLSFIALYYCLHYCIYALVLPLGGKVAARFGLEKSLVLSLPIMVVYFIVLAAIPQASWLVWAAIVLLTAHKIFYWPAYHALFAKFSNSHNRGTELSWMRLLREGVGILGPLTGGIIATVFSFSTLFIFTAALVLMSAIPLLKTKESYRASNFTYGDTWRLILSRRYRNMTLAMAGMGENLIDMVFWPVFLFIILGSTETLGIVSSVNIAIMTFIGFFIGEMSDHLPRKYVLRLHLPFLVISYLLRPLAGTRAQGFLTETLSRVAYGGVNLPMTYRLYSEAQTTSIIRYTVAFELVLAIAKALTALLLVVIFSSTLPYTGFVMTFTLAALASVLYLFL